MNTLSNSNKHRLVCGIKRLLVSVGVRRLLVGLVCVLAFHVQYAQPLTTDLGMLLVARAEAASVWNDTNWTLYDTITIQSENIDEDLTDFPVYVDLSDLSDTFWETTPTDATKVGTDIRVTTNDGSPVELARELVLASSTLQTGELHFKADSISSTTDTTFRIYYNGNTYGDYANDETYGAQNVWTSDYRMVQHLNEDPDTAGVGGIKDSTSNVINATSSGLTTSNVGIGKVGGGYDLNASNANYLEIGDPVGGELDFGANQSFSISTWVQSSNTTNGQTLTSKRGTNGYELRYTSGGGFFLRIDEGGSQYDVATAGSVMDGVWHYITAGRDATQAFIYVDGVLSNTHADTSLADLSNTVIVGMGNELPQTANEWGGSMDEIRFSSTSRSAAWVKAEYYNQSATTDFYSLTSGISSSTIANHSATQVSNAFDFKNKTDESLFAFSITPESGNATVTKTVISLRGAQKVLSGDFSNIRLYKDHDNDAAYDVTDEQVGGLGTMVLSGQLGTITFLGDYLATTTTNYLVVADWNAPSRGSMMELSLATDGIIAQDEYGGLLIYGSVDSVQHYRGNQGGGGGGAAIGGAAPDGDGDRGGGGSGGGSEIDTNTGGATIGNDPNYAWPTAQSGSWTNGGNAIDQADGTYASDNTGTANDFSDHGFVVPGSNTIQGIVVKLEVSGTTAAGDIGVQLSWNGGTSWTSTKTTQTLTTSDTVVTLGGAGDTWGRSWNVSEFSDMNFAVRLTGNPSSNTVRVDAIQVRVYHQASGGGSGGGGGI